MSQRPAPRGRAVSGTSLSFLEPGDTALLDEVYERVFRPAFVVKELPDIEPVRPMPGRVVLVASDGSGPVAGAVFESMTDVGLLCYMATRSDVRSRGLGTLLLAAMRERWTADAVSLVVAEVRDPRVWPESPTDRPDARLRFYDLNGCFLLPVPWVQPSLDGGGREEAMLLLAAHGIGLGDPVPVGRLTAWARRYYCEAEGGEPADPQYRALLDRFAGSGPEVLPVEAYPTVPLL